MRREDIAETRRALARFQRGGGTWRALSAHCGVPHQKLAALAAGTAAASPARCAAILAALPTAPLGRRTDRRLRQRLDEHALAARAPCYHRLSEALYEFAGARDRMTPEERDAAWREIGTLHDEYTKREQRGSGWASYAERAGVDSTDTTKAPALYRRERRRKRRGLVDILSPRTREFLIALRATRSPAARTRREEAAHLLPLPRKTGPLHLREIPRDEFDDPAQWAEHRRRASKAIRQGALEELCRQIAEAARVATQLGAPVLSRCAPPTPRG